MARRWHGLSWCGLVERHAIWEGWPGRARQAINMNVNMNINFNMNINVNINVNMNIKNNTNMNIISARCGLKLSAFAEGGREGAWWSCACG